MLAHMFSLGRGVTVHKSAKGRALSADAAPTVRTQYIPPGCFLSHPENRISNGRNKAGSFSTKIPFLSISRKDSVNNC